MFTRLRIQSLYRLPRVHAVYRIVHKFLSAVLGGSSLSVCLSVAKPTLHRVDLMLNDLDRFQVVIVTWAEPGF